jgi:hypothetical protein
MALSPSNKKMCSKCGADVTFARRVLDPKGRYLCLNCAKATAAKAPVAPEDDLELLTRLEPAAQTPARAVAVAKPSMVRPKKEKRRVSRSTEINRWVAGGVAIIVILIVAFFLVNKRPWDEQNRLQILSMKNGADALLTARVLFLKSDEFAGWRRQADDIVTTLNTELIGEDSVYRGLSKRTKASRNLLGLYVKAEGHLLSTNVDASVDRILSNADSDLITEDSAIRAIDENDQAFFKMLGPLCMVLDGKNSTLKSTFDTQSHAAVLAGIGDDSAIRAIDSYSDASMQVLRAIVSAQGLASKADGIISDVQTQNIGEDSAWRSAMRNENGSMRLLLLMVSQEDPATAASIQSTADTAIIGDDSALRAQEAYDQGKVDALRWMVGHP